MKIKSISILVAIVGILLMVYAFWVQPKIQAEKAKDGASVVVKVVPTPTPVSSTSVVKPSATPLK